jgi:hypothetical protein
VVRSLDSPIRAAHDAEASLKFVDARAVTPPLESRASTLFQEEDGDEDLAKFLPMLKDYLRSVSRHAHTC